MLQAYVTLYYLTMLKSVEKQRKFDSFIRASHEKTIHSNRHKPLDLGFIKKHRVHLTGLPIKSLPPVTRKR